MLISAATAFSLLGDQVLYAVLPIVYDDLGLAAIEVGILLSANRWIRLFTNELAHRVSAHLPGRPLMAASFVLGALTTAAYYFSASFTILLLARLSWGLSWSFIRHLGVSAAMHNVPVHAAGQTMGWYNGVSRAGSVAGLLGGAILVDTVGFHAAVLILAVISPLALPLGLVGYKGLQVPKETQRQRAPWPLLLMGVSLGAVGPGFVMSTLGAALELRLTENLLLAAASLTGVLLAARYVLDSVLAPLLGSSFDRWGFKTAAAGYFFAGGCALITATAMASMWTFALMIIVFFVCGTALQSGVAARASRLGSGAFARYVTASDLGSASGPLLGWIIVASVGTPDYAIALGGLVFCASVGFVLATQTSSSS